MSYRDLLRSVRKRPGMFFGRSDLSFEKLVAYLEGLNSGVLGVARTALFDLVAAGHLEVFRSGAELFARRTRELRGDDDS